MKKTTKLTAKELEEKFDDGNEDVLDQFDVKNATKRVALDLPVWLIKKLDAESNRQGITRQSLIKTLLVKEADQFYEGNLRREEIILRDVFGVEPKSVQQKKNSTLPKIHLPFIDVQALDEKLRKIVAEELESKGAG